MLKKKLALAAAIIGAVAVLSIPAMTTAAKAKPAAKFANDGRAKCYECHDEVKALKEGSKHAKLACTVCHDKLDAHMNDPEKNKPVTTIDQSLCGKCHKNQYESFFFNMVILLSVRVVLLDRQMVFVLWYGAAS